MGLFFFSVNNQTGMGYKVKTFVNISNVLLIQCTLHICTSPGQKLSMEASKLHRMKVGLDAQHAFKCNLPASLVLMGRVHSLYFR